MIRLMMGCWTSDDYWVKWEEGEWEEEEEEEERRDIWRGQMPTWGSR